MVAEVLKHEFFKEFEIPSLKDLIDNWGDLKLLATDIDLVECFLPLCKEVDAGSSARRFLVRPTEHPQTAHPYTLAESKDSKVSVKKNAKAQIDLNREGLVVTKTKTLGVEARPGKQKLSGQLALTGKHGKKMKYIDIRQSCSINKLKIKENCRDSCDEFAKGFCLSIFHTGVKKCLSNAAILKNYQTALDGMKIYHDFIINSQAPEIDKTLAPLVEIALFCSYL